MSKNTTWTDARYQQLADLYQEYRFDNRKWSKIGEALGISGEAARSAYRFADSKKMRKLLDESPYPKYDAPLEMEGDAVVFPDLEMPFHHADFVNMVMELAQEWGIDQCIMAGDMLHLDSMSGWEPNWLQPNGKGGLDDAQERALMDFIMGLGKRQQSIGMELIAQIGHKHESGSPNISEELQIAREATNRMARVFKRVDVIIGNHEGRLLRSLDSPMFASEIGNLINRRDWRIAPYYFSYLTSNGERFRIEHPKSAAKYAAETLAAKFHCHILMAHSHAWRMARDISGKFWAIQMGCCVDELRLPYASQRSTTAPAHALGAVIVRRGYPYLLHQDTRWDDLVNIGRV